MGDGGGGGDREIGKMGEERDVERERWMRGIGREGKGGKSEK